MNVGQLIRKLLKLEGRRELQDSILITNIMCYEKDGDKVFEIKKLEIVENIVYLVIKEEEPQYQIGGIKVG